MSIRDRIVGLERARAGDLVPHPENWRRHPERQRAILRDLLEEVGIADAVIARGLPDGRLQLIDGHLRSELDPELELPVLVLDVDEDEARKLLLSLDPLAAMAQTGREALEALVGQVQPDTDGFARLLARHGSSSAVDDGQAPEPPRNPLSKPGDLWVLGAHRVLCGDATSAQDVARLLDGAAPFLCVTDPPYGVDYDPNWRNVAAAKGNLAYAARRVGKVAHDDRADWREAWALTPSDVLYSWHPPGATSLVHAAALQDSGFAIRMQIIWAKAHFPIGRGDYHVQHEPCWYAVRDGKAARRTEDRTQTTLWEIVLDPNVEGGHSTQKPLECMARPIRNHDAPEVYDPFSGSGTSLIAAEQLDRRCYAMEITPAYVDVICARWQRLTGEKPVLERTGRAHDFAARGTSLRGGASVRRPAA